MKTKTLFCLCLAACTPKQAETGTVDITDATCAELATQPEPEWVSFTCTLVRDVDGVAKTFLAKVKKEDAPTFAARHCSGGKLAP